MFNSFGLTFDDIDQVIAMAWREKPSFEDIQARFGLSRREVVKLMRREMKVSAFRRWERGVMAGRN